MKILAIEKLKEMLKSQLTSCEFQSLCITCTGYDTIFQTDRYRISKDGYYLDKNEDIRELSLKQKNNVKICLSELEDKYQFDNHHRGNFSNITLR